MEVLGPPPSYSEAVSPSANLAQSSQQRQQQQVWSVQLPSADAAREQHQSPEITPPPSYAESQRANSSRCTGCTAASAWRARRSRRDSNPCCGSLSVATPQRLHSTRSCSSPAMSRRHLAAVFPAEHRHNYGTVGVGGRRALCSSHNNADVESLASAGAAPTAVGHNNTRVWADRLRDVFLSLLMRILLIFLFVLFLRILIGQLAPDRE